MIDASSGPYFEQLTKTFAMCDESDQWFYKILGRQFGPVPFAFLVELAHAGHLPFAAVLKQLAADDWIRADSVDGLFDHPAKPSEPLKEPPPPPKALRFEAESISEADGPAAGIGFWQSLPTIASDSIPFWKRLPTIAADSIPLWQRLPTIAAEDHVERQKEDDGEKREWYVRLYGQELGPMPLQKLVVMAERGELAIGDEVRHSSADTWGPAEEIEELSCALLLYQQKAISDFQLAQAPIDEPSAELDEEPDGEDDFELTVSCADDTPPETKPADVESSVAPVPADSPIESKDKADEKEEAVVAPLVPPDPQPAVVEASGSPQGDELEPNWEAEFGREQASVSARPAPVGMGVRPDAKERRLSWRAMVGIAACITIAFVAIMRWTATDDLTYWSKIDSVWETLRDQRLKDVADAELPDVIADSKIELAYLIEELEEHASPNEPAKQNMLWAARDYLQPMLKKIEHRDTHAEELFIEQMEIARGLISKESGD
jgi:hypothetical protein